MAELAPSATKYIDDVIAPRMQEVFDGYVIVGFARGTNGELMKYMVVDSTSANNPEVANGLKPIVAAAKNWGNKP